MLYCSGLLFYCFGKKNSIGDVSGPDEVFRPTLVPYRIDLRDMHRSWLWISMAFGPKGTGNTDKDGSRLSVLILTCCQRVVMWCRRDKGEAGNVANSRRKRAILETTTNICAEQWCGWVGTNWLEIYPRLPVVGFLQRQWILIVRNCRQYVIRRFNNNLYIKVHKGSSSTVDFTHATNPCFGPLTSIRIFIC
jgi:hypothetical protein